jgi:hypothetical protein
MNTKDWAESHEISSAPTPPAVADYDTPCARTAREIAERAVIIQGVVAVAYEVDSGRIVEWFRKQSLWDKVTPKEKKFLSCNVPTKKEQMRFRWHAEAEWALLWAVGKVGHLGLPTRCCDTARLVDDIMPALGENISEFIDACQLRHPGLLLAEDDRTYNMWCYAKKARREGKLPEDLNWSVLYERRYAFEWLDGNDNWDEVTCDA